MAKKIKGITVEIGGDTTSLDKALSASKKKSGELTKELKEVDRALKFNPDNIELLTQKQTLLTERVEETSNQLKILKDAQSEVQKQFDNNEIGADQYREFQRSIIETESRLKTFENQLEDCNQTIQKLGDGTTETVRDIDKLTSTISDQEKELSQLQDEYVNVVLSQGKGSDEAKALSRQMSALNNELGENKQRLSDAQSEAKQFATSLDKAGDSAEESGDGFTIVGGTIADLASNAIQSAIGAIGDLIGSLFDLTEVTEEYRSMQAKLEGSAKRAGYSAEYATNLYKLMYQFLGDDQMATNAVTNLLGIGASQETLNSLLDGARGVWASYGDSIPIESLTEAINETIQVGKVTGTFADTINWVNISNEEMANSLGKGSEAQKAFNKAIKDGETQEDAFSMALSATTDQQERANIVAQFLNDTYDDSSETYEELAGSMLDANRAEVELKETQAELGESMAPVSTALMDLKNKALEAITPMVNSLSQSFMNLLGWLKEHPTVMKIVTATVIALATGFTVLAGALAIQGLINGVRKAIELLNLTLWDNPITWIVVALAGLVAGFMYLWNTCDGFREFWINLWDIIVQYANMAWSTITEYFTLAWETIKTIFTPVVEYFRNMFTMAWDEIKIVWDLVKPYFQLIWEAIQIIFSVVAPILSMFFKNAWESIKFVWNVAVLYFTTIWENIKAVFSVVQAVLGGFFKTAWEVIKAVWNNAVAFFQLVWAGIKAVFSVVSAVLTGDFSTAWENIKNVWNKVGDFFNTVWTGIKNIFNSVGSWFGSTFSSAWQAVKNVFSNWGSFFSGLWSQITNTFSNIGTNIGNAIGSSVKSALNGVISSIERTINSGINLINGAISVINAIPGVSIGKIGTLSFPRLAKGGYAMGNSLVEIGEENKKEVVLPLERNLGWAEIMSKELMRHMTNDTPLQKTQDPINGVTIARQIENTFKNLNQSNDVRSMSELVDLVSEYFPKLIEASKHSIILDSGVLVGETVSKMDEELALQYQLKERGV